MWARIIIGAVLLALVAAALILTAGGWARLAGIEMSMAGIVALVLGSLLTLALGGGLMFLVFYSARQGYDEQVQDYSNVLTGKEPLQDATNDA
jgi:ABC-type siderophore export system fused ATPase/permease subunit